METEQFLISIVIIVKIQMNLTDHREEYIKHTLDEKDTGNDPVIFFKNWLEEAIRGNVPEPTAMSVSTVSDSGRPSSRIVLLKGIEEDKFLFYTNYNSDKGKQISSNPRVALLFFWPGVERQVRVEGSVEKILPAESDKYFNSRPPESRIGAVVSPQSEVLKDRHQLEEMYAHVAGKFRTALIMRPGHWGGYAVSPELIEFWQGRAGRMHDRIRFRRVGNGWIKERLAP
ncbi:MAG: pyridoxamine 5'-phosphate oxidase [Bacteroidota bacterium]